MDKVLMSIKQLEGYLFSLASFSDCPQPVDPLTIALPIGGSVVLAGIIAMVIWRLVQNRIDTQRYEDFMKEIKESNWTEDTQNPVYRAPAMRTENPQFKG